MNGNKVIKEEMTLDQKLAAIDAMMATTQVEFKKNNPGAAPLDPSDLTMCEGCQ